MYWTFAFVVNGYLKNGSKIDKNLVFKIVFWNPSKSHKIFMWGVYHENCEVRCTYLEKTLKTFKIWYILRRQNFGGFEDFSLDMFIQLKVKVLLMDITHASVVTTTFSKKYLYTKKLLINLKKSIFEHSKSIRNYVGTSVMWK